MNVLDSVKSINSLEIAIKQYMIQKERWKCMTLQQYQMSLFEESEVSMLSVADFRAKLSQLQESEKVSKILEELSSLKLQGSHLFSDHAIYSLRTYRIP
nr:MAG TPA: hypothetical protein [Caudoviricetes sp.]